MLLTKIERINKDGSINYNQRWSTQKIKPASFKDYFANLFFGDEGVFRSIMFLVSGKQSFENFGRNFIDNNGYNSLFEKGGYTSDSSFAELTFKEKTFLFSIIIIKSPMEVVLNYR